MIKWRRDPVYVAFDTTSTPVWQVPFPAVTICNMNMANIDMVHQVRESFETNGSDLAMARADVEVKGSCYCRMQHGV